MCLHDSFRRAGGAGREQDVRWVVRADVRCPLLDLRARRRRRRDVKSSHDTAVAGTGPSMITVVSMSSSGAPLAASRSR